MNETNDDAMIPRSMILANIEWARTRICNHRGGKRRKMALSLLTDIERRVYTKEPIFPESAVPMPPAAAPAAAEDGAGVPDGWMLVPKIGAPVLYDNGRQRGELATIHTSQGGYRAVLFTGQSASPVEVWVSELSPVPTTPADTAPQPTEEPLKRKDDVIWEFFPGGRKQHGVIVQMMHDECIVSSTKGGWPFHYSVKTANLTRDTEAAQ